MKKTNKNDRFPTNTGTLPRRFHLTGDKASGGEGEGREGRGLQSRILRRNPAGPWAPRCPATPPPKPTPWPPAGELPGGLCSDAARAERFEEKQGKGEAGGRGSSPSRSRKPTRELQTRNPGLRTAHPRVLGPGQAGPASRPPPLPQAVNAAAPPLAAGCAPSRSPQDATLADRGPRQLLVGGGPGTAGRVREVEERGSHTCTFLRPAVFCR